MYWQFCKIFVHLSISVGIICQHLIRNTHQQSNIILLPRNFYLNYMWTTCEKTQTCRSPLLALMTTSQSFCRCQLLCMKSRTRCAPATYFGSSTIVDLSLFRSNVVSESRYICVSIAFIVAMMTNLWQRRTDQMCNYIQTIDTVVV